MDVIPIKLFDNIDLTTPVKRCLIYIAQAKMKGNMRRYFRLFFLCVFLILLILISCNKRTKSYAQIEVIDGVEYIHNPNTPRFPKA